MAADSRETSETQASSANVQDLSSYAVSKDYSPGATYWRQLLWFFVGAPLLESRWLPISRVKVTVLRWFGAEIGVGVRIKPGVRVKFPWKLRVGKHCWLGEYCWIDNLVPVYIEDNVCISQGRLFVYGKP